MLGLVICILIVYGVTLLLVQGKVFEPLKIKFALFLDTLDAKISGRDDLIAELIEKRDLPAYTLQGWDETLKNLQECDQNNEEEFKFAQEMNKKLFELIRIEVMRKYSYLNWLYKPLNKLQDLLQCMMCTGFWVGLILCLATLGGGISILGISLQIVTSGGYNVLPAIFLMACLFSGTTWVIHSLVDLLYELKEGLSDLMKRG